MVIENGVDIGFSFMKSTLLGVRAFIWFYFIGSLILGIGVIIYWKREQIKRRWYSFRYPEKLIKIIVHYKNNVYRIFWRLIPDDNSIVIGGKKYEFSDKELIKKSDFFIKEDEKNKGMVFNADGIKYHFIKNYIIKKRKSDFPEMHYYYNIPTPLSFDIGKKKIEFSASQLEQFKENDLFVKLLTMDTQKQLMSFVIMICIVNAIISFVVLAKLMEWIK